MTRQKTQAAKTTALGNEIIESLRRHTWGLAGDMRPEAFAPSGQPGPDSRSLTQFGPAVTRAYVPQTRPAPKPALVPADAAETRACAMLTSHAAGAPTAAVGAELLEELRQAIAPPSAELPTIATAYDDDSCPAPAPTRLLNLPERDGPRPAFAQLTHTQILGPRQVDLLAVVSQGIAPQAWVNPGLSRRKVRQRDAAPGWWKRLAS